LSLFQEVKKKLKRLRRNKKRKPRKLRIKFLLQQPQSLFQSVKREKLQLESQLLHQFQHQSQRKKRKKKVKKEKDQNQSQFQLNQLLSRRRRILLISKTMMRMMVSQLKYLSPKSQVEKPKSKRKSLIIPLQLIMQELNLLRPKKTRNTSSKQSRIPLRNSMNKLRRPKKPLRKTKKP
jgi:hypothetical protein